MRAKVRLIPVVILASLVIAGCAGKPAVMSQAYAELKSHRVFEYEFPIVWKGIEAAVKEFKITSRTPEKVDALEIRKLRERTLETDWIYSQSRDKYQEYTVDGFPKKKYLQIRIKYAINARSVMGGTEVRVQTEEEIERLNSDGTSTGYDKSDAPDSTRAAEILEKINLEILAATP